MKKVRIDEYLVAQDYYQTKDAAMRAIMAGLVFDDNIRIDTAGEKIDPLKIRIRVKDQRKKYVSRGGLKLEKALQQFDLDINDRVHLDIGSSTGGFTDCALQNGARHVYALDVGTNQLDYRLRIHPKVTVMEQTNFRYVSRDLFNPVPDFVSIDVSFISLSLIFKTLVDVIKDDSDIIALIKPQFEAHKEQVDKGIVKSKDTHIAVIQKVLNYANDYGLKPKHLTYSPISGTKGNIEYLLHLKFKKDAVDNHSHNKQQIFKDTDIISVINEAFNTLNHC
ncbi:TlyA family RNA methyltransferase [Macrococcoides caseolyticum]|uniref:TlyA family RNA methyltransferase n=1 Tax=Macrococcoides caseolyticum TaxID=69966 RepID=UPI00105CF20A|nr:TlyA family RNA methyltransferase [Macrococcus caseolyticus]MEB8170975.1 TlyA family RNA methyltransferase [Macrococcus caseolyticus]TDM28244.1 TlyA family RNA methyltransferase [Macrococcus caseolyticus]